MPSTKSIFGLYGYLDLQSIDESPAMQANILHWHKGVQAANFKGHSLFLRCSVTLELCPLSPESIIPFCLKWSIRDSFSTKEYNGDYRLSYCHSWNHCFGKYYFFLILQPSLSIRSSVYLISKSALNTVRLSDILSANLWQEANFS